MDFSKVVKIEKDDSAQNELCQEDIDEMLQDFARSEEAEETSNNNGIVPETHIRCTLRKYGYKVVKTMEDYLEKNYILREIIDCQNFTIKCDQSDTKVHLIGVYSYELCRHYLISLNKFKPNVENPARIFLDMADVKEFPVVNRFVEVYGTLQFRPQVTVHVHFFHDLGEDKNKVFEYVELLKQRMEMFPSD